MNLPNTYQSRFGLLGWLWLAAVVIATDQLTKWMAEAYLTAPTPIPQADGSMVVHSFPYEIFPHFNLTLAYNYGAAFSFLGNQDGWQVWFFAILAIAVSAFIVNWMRKLNSKQTWVAVGLSLILGGAIGNLIDRLLYGKVIDFIDIYFDVPFWRADYHFATFNVADISITVGATLLIIISLFAAEQLE